MPDNPSAIFLTGYVGSGKTTAIEQVIQRLSLVTSGFLTPSLRENGRVKEVRLVSLRETLKPAPLLASIESGQLLPHVDVFENEGVRVLQDALENQADCLIMDELGFLETKAFRFRAMVHRCINEGPLVLGVLKRGDAPLPSSVVARPDVTVMEMKKARRNEITSSLLALVSSLLPGEGVLPKPIRARPCFRTAVMKYR